MREIITKLNDGIDLGSNNICKDVKLTQPKVIHKPIVASLQQGLMQALTSSQNTANKSNETTNTTDEVDNSQWVMLLSTSPIQNLYVSFCEKFKDLLLHKTTVCFIGDKPLGETWCDRMSNDDFDLVMGEYIANFLLPSPILKALKKI